MADDASKIAELDRKVVNLESQNQELERKVRNLEDRLRIYVSLVSPSQLSEALCEAAESGDTQKVQKLLKEGANVNFSDKFNCVSPLLAAAIEGQVEVIALLIESGAHLNVITYEGDTALHLAASWGYSLCLKKLIEAGAYLDEKNSNGDTPLHLATVNGYYACVRTLLDAGADQYMENNSGKVPEDLASDDSIKNLF